MAPNGFPAMIRSLSVTLIFCLSIKFISSDDANFKSRTRSLQLVCVDSGLCTKCTKDEMSFDYCKETGRKMRTICTNRIIGQEIDDYRSCASTAEDDQLRVIFFQIFMAVLGGLAFCVVQGRKHMTMYDTRKQNRNPRRQGAAEATW